MEAVSNGGDMSDERVIQMLEEIRDLQKLQVEPTLRALFRH